MSPPSGDPDGYPSSWLVSSPQQRIAPSGLRAQVWSKPASTGVTSGSTHPCAQPLPQTAAPLHVPAAHASPLVHASPSSQAAVLSL
jgi:hypothetical protein